MARAALTPREREVLALVREGLTNAEAAERLGVSAKTIEAHLGRIYLKAGVRSRTQAILWASRPKGGP